MVNVRHSSCFLAQALIRSCIRTRWNVCYESSHPHIWAPAWPAPTVVYHSVHRRWGFCSCTPWTCGACRSWSALCGSATHSENWLLSPECTSSQLKQSKQSYTFSEKETTAASLSYWGSYSEFTKVPPSTECPWWHCIMFQSSWRRWFESSGTEMWDNVENAWCIPQHFTHMFCNGICKELWASYWPLQTAAILPSVCFCNVGEFDVL